MLNVECLMGGSLFGGWCCGKVVMVEGCVLVGVVICVMLIKG